MLLRARTPVDRLGAAWSPPWASAGVRRVDFSYRSPYEASERDILLMDKKAAHEETTLATTQILPITLNGETREVPFRTLSEAAPDSLIRYWSPNIFAARIGRGVKAHRGSILAVEGSPEELRRLGYSRGARNVVEVDGRLFGVRLQTVIRNRQASVFGWADTYAGTPTAAQFNDGSGIHPEA